ncbi:MAG: LPP20 family lipoprotein [Bacteroidaceae bacterium]|nr:LPP20 family lipoprotein [Bacteroidaceae bacterium]
MKNTSILFILLLFCNVISAQSVENIKASDEYLYGEGRGESLKAADNAALQDLISKISVSVESGFDKVEEAIINQAGIKDYHHACKLVISTYSQATLHNTQRIVIENEPDAQVFRYVKRSEVDKVFESRRLKVFDMVASASRAVEKGKVDDALRYYYWSYCLLQSIPWANAVVDANGHVLTHWIPEQMNEVFGDVKAYKVNEKDGVAEICVTYKGQPVTSMDYTYFDGMDWSSLYGAKDGRGFVELRPGMTTENLKIKCEYEYSGEAHIDKEISTVVNVMKGRVFRNAYVAIAPLSSPQGGMTNPMAQKSYVKETVAVSSPLGGSEGGQSIALLPNEEAAPYSKSIETVIAAIKSGNYASAEACFTEDGRDMYRRLISYGQARIMGEPSYAFYTMGDNEVTCRSVPMSFSFRNNGRKFVEDVTFTFNDEGKIDYLAFALDEKSTTDILQHSMWSEYARKILAEFLENYKTAYALKRLDYIRSIFDDNAVIITGKVVTRQTSAYGEVGGEYFNNKYVQYTRLGKEQYMRNLERCFNSNEYINIRFANNDVVKAGVGGEVYGIQIKQDYYSTNYGDTGYLFLMVDLNNPKQPIIKVRSWQPERDPNFGLIDLSHF